MNSPTEHPDMSPEAVERRLRDLSQIYKLGMSLRGAKWLGPVNPPASESQPATTAVPSQK